MIVLSDTGCGTVVPNRKRPAEPVVWTLRSFLEYTINPGGAIPYLVMTTHCHYDHILGIGHLPPTCKVQSKTSTTECETGSLGGKTKRPPCTTVLTSAQGKAFVTPYSNLSRHSLCDTINVEAPHYQVKIWAEDFEKIVYEHFSGPMIDTGITILQTPGHTPDSLTWYDAQTRMISVGDSLYERESTDTRHARWGKEPPMPTIFDAASDLFDWWQSLKKVIEFVKEKNAEVEEAEVDAQEKEEEGYCVVEHDDVEGWYVNQWEKDDMAEEWLWVPHSSSSDTSPPPQQDAHLSRSLRLLKPRLTLSAAHVTVSTDAYACLLEMQYFMRSVLRNEVPSKHITDSRGEETWLWDDCLEEQGSDVVPKAKTKDCHARFSVQAPLKVIEKGRTTIPREEWDIPC